MANTVEDRLADLERGFAKDTLVTVLTLQDARWLLQQVRSARAALRGTVYELEQWLIAPDRSCSLSRRAIVEGRAALAGQEVLDAR